MNISVVFGLMFPSFFGITIQIDLETLINKDDNIHKKKQQTDKYINFRNKLYAAAKQSSETVRQTNINTCRM